MSAAPCSFYATRHIREAAAFSQRMGGLDETVKAYFFKLPPEKRL